MFLKIYVFLKKKGEGPLVITSDSKENRVYKKYNEL